ncbi:uroporphyrinogen III synthase [Malaciobacter mytili]|uniref:uroporphyrinogen-III synthase n=1 Tax=Malaciobacter mytili TaxID=603050 RepID=UPI00100AE42E|nr:uroporphyrinogen-III synthase [Malaciobacter mytili]RXI43965.1 uroporphyrinogen III synthase [Malaciobacter mytili]
MKNIYLLSNLKFPNVKNLEVFKINYLKKQIDFNRYDAIIFTSKNAVYSIDSFNKQWKNLPCYAIAKKTAQIIEKVGGKVDFVGNSGHGNEFAYELLSVLKNKKVLYLKASRTVSNLVEILKSNNIQIEDIAIYETVCNKELNTNLKDNSIFIFTSPSSIECFFKKYSWRSSFEAIVIGNTTAKFLPKEIKYKVSNSTAIEECIKLAKNL